MALFPCGTVQLFSADLFLFLQLVMMSLYLPILSTVANFCVGDFVPPVAKFVTIRSLIEKVQRG